MSGTSLMAVEQPARRRRVPAAVYILVGLAVSGWLGFLLLAAVLLARPSPETAANEAIDDRAPQLLVGPVMVAEPWVPTALPIQIGPANAIPRGGWIRISGIPALASLSSGYTIGGGIWKVPVSALPTLTVVAPTRETIGSELRISLMTVDGAALAEVKSVLAVIPPALCGAGHTTATSSLPDDIAPGGRYRPASGLPLPVLTGDDDRERAEALVLQGDIHRLQGRFESARGYYERAASMGWPRAAMALAATFDPHELKGILKADIESARAWYRRSRELMNATVEFHLKRLEAVPERQELLPTRLDVESSR